MKLGEVFMIALVVVDTLRHQPCLEGNYMVLLATAYDMVLADPRAAISVLAGRVATAAAQQGLIMAAPAGSFTFQQLHNVQQQIQQPSFVQQRPTQRPPGPPRHCWRCGASGHMTGICSAPINPGNPYPFKPQRA
jgi:hypothetical protein